MTRVLVTGSAGFVGYHVTERLLSEGVEVIGFDNFNDYYEVSLKEARNSRLEQRAGYTLVRGDLKDGARVEDAFKLRLDGVIHLAAQAGVRYSLDHPEKYVDSNLVGFANVLEACRKHEIGHLVYASSSSVYGANVKTPFQVSDPVNHPVSLYAATKKANELMAHTYSHLFRLPTTGLRFFTVYGPWGRPDMAYFKFTKSILEGKPIDVYNFGNLKRDFTYIDEIVEGVIRVLRRPAESDPSWNPAIPNPGTSSAPYRLFNIGTHQPVDLMRFIQVLESKLGTKANLNMLPMQPGDVYETFADVSDLAAAIGFAPSTSLEEGLERFVSWYREFYN
ncbi:MAG TPA: NAD-dependent epimerase [Fimbriimonadaceae bacterium]|nr:NAD-dependent epimerase [Fimbriimonadaceae bacterium]